MKNKSMYSLCYEKGSPTYPAVFFFVQAMYLCNIKQWKSITDLLDTLDLARLGPAPIVFRWQLIRETHVLNVLFGTVQSIRISTMAMLLLSSPVSQIEACSLEDYVWTSKRAFLWQ